MGRYLAGTAAVGPRWSCGALWAEDGNAQADDTDWEDEATWPTAHAYDADGEMAVGIFVAGLDASDDLRAASWGLGQSEPLPSSIQPSSCSLTLKGSSTAEANDRVCIITPWDVLYVGRVEDVSETTTPGRTETQLSVVDELARVALIEWPDGRELGGIVTDMLEELMQQGGVVLSWYGTIVQPTTTLTIRGGYSSTVPWVDTAVRSGSVLSLIGEVLYQTVSQGAWTPAGLRISALDLLYLDGDDRGWDDVDVTDLDAFASYTVSRNVGRVRNDLTVTDGATDYTEAWAESVEAYGKRAITVDVTDWTDTAWADGEWSAIIEGDDDEASYTGPLPVFNGKANIGRTRHAIARLMPFDYVTDGHPNATATTERYRVLRVAHRLTPDAWGVDVEGVLVRRNTDYPEPDVQVTFNGSNVTFNGSNVTFDSS